MAMTTKEGIRTLGSYAYCGGIGETARRKAQIGAGRLSPVWTGPSKGKQAKARKSKAKG